MGNAFDEQCAEGARADALLAERRYEDAEDAYMDLLGRVLESALVDQFILSKGVLGLLLARIGREDHQGAHRIWAARDTDPEHPLAIGIDGLENHRASLHDLIIYSMISAHLASMAMTEQARWMQIVDDKMERVVRYAAEKEPLLLPLALGNWRKHLIELQDGQDDPARLARWQRTKDATFSGLVPAGKLDFPAPSPWAVDWEDGGGKASSSRDGAAEPVELDEPPKTGRLR